MASDRESGGGPKTARQRIIEEAQLQCYDARSEYQQAALLLSGQVSREHVLRLQQAVADYYWALRPLRDEDPVRDWWNDVVLSEQWTRSVTVTEPRVQGTTIVQAEETKEVPFEGLETLRDHLDRTETVTTTKTGMRGRREETVTRKKVLDPEVLVDITGVLDDAADKLGFSPEVKSDDHVDEVSEDDLEDLFERGPKEMAADGGEQDGDS
jgi:hypothetical protein